MSRSLLLLKLLLCGILISSSISALAENGTATADRSPATALAGLDTVSDLQTTLMAAEPLLLSPANIDVDHLGRIWVCEVVNYRRFANKDNAGRPEGDRIAVLEDTDGDGVIDKDTTFYQSPEIDSAHGVCVLGQRVIVSAGENVFSFYDDDGDLKADRKEVLFTGIKGAQHDHGIHSVTFGLDGRLYFNFGNNGEELHTPDGQLVTDIAGNKVIVQRQPYQQGLAFRCEQDGSRVDTLGWNFRNNWELCVDSFGTIWQSDNDDDGNRGVRINYVMEYGNYGYRDELTGAGWREPRTGWEETIPLRHWHLNDPGVVPNLLQTGAGSPTGILIYEGQLLPKRFHNQLIHCDAGPNVVRSYAVTNDGAGYKAKINEIVTGTRDQWFRPSDVCVAPDGSLIIADWYDPGVGGHRQGDVTRGRIFRVAPPDADYKIVTSDFSTVAGSVQALRSPNVATRYLAWKALKKFGAAAEPALTKMFQTDDNVRLRARALWVLGQLEGKADAAVRMAIVDENSDIRITGLRLARRMQTGVIEAVESLLQDTNTQVRRECALALRHTNDPKKAELWAGLAAQLPEHDRWYLEALGIAADGAWDECLAAYMNKVKDDENPLTTGYLTWRSRGTNSAAALVKMIARFAESPVRREYLLACFRSLDFQAPQTVAREVRHLIDPDALANMNSDIAPVVIAESLQRLGTSDFSQDVNAKAALNRALEGLQGTPAFVELVERFHVADRYGDVIDLAQTHPAEQLGVQAVQSLLREKQWERLGQALRVEDSKRGIAMAQALGNSLDSAVTNVLLSAVRDEELADDVRKACVRAAAKVPRTAQELGDMIRGRQLDAKLKQTAAAALHSASAKETQALAAKLFPLPPVKEGKPLPPIRDLVRLKPDPANGRLVFHTTGTCQKCHVVNKIGREIGPDLSEIGSKLSPSAMFESIIYPSAGISHNYESYLLILDNGTTVTGLITSETADNISIKGDDALVRSFPKSDVDEIVKQDVSLMPADLQKVMTVQEIVDVVGYMQSLKKK